MFICTSARLFSIAIQKFENDVPTMEAILIELAS